MSSLTFWRRRNNKGSSDKDSSSLDLFLQLSYMSAIAASGIPRHLIFERAAALPFSCSGYFKDVHLLVQNLRYDYPEACRVVGQSAKGEEIKTLLLRLSGSLASGEPEMDFLAQETQVLMESYGNQYERKVESLKMWTDGFAAATVSAALVIVIGIVSTLIYKMATSIIIGLIVVAVLVNVLGAWIIYRAAPQEVKTVSSMEGSREQRLARKLFKILFPAALLLCSFLILRGTAMGWVFITAGVLLFPVGVLGNLDDRKIDRRDREISAFLRSLGSIATSMGATVAQALTTMDLRAAPFLAPEAHRLRARFASRIDPRLCWQRFISETGSELVNRSVTMFQDAISFGGEAEEIGSRSSLLAMKVSLLRSQRHLISSTFGWLSLAMHGAITGLLIFIVAVVSIFGGMVQATDIAETTTSSVPTLGLFSFNTEAIQLLQGALIPVILILSGVNAFAPKVAEGGHSYKLLYNLSFTLAISGICMLLVPQLASMIFGMAPAL